MLKTLKFAVLVSLPVFVLTSCNKESKTIVVGASSTPHALILEEAKDYVLSKGFKLDITIFNDYVLPNFALENGELDANYFQHKPYLEEFNSANGTHLISVKDIHFEPMGIYAGTKSDISAFLKTDTIIVPSDKSNYDRAINLLKEHGMNKANIIEVEAQNIPLMLSDCAFAVINGNYALSAGVVERFLINEDKDSDIAKRMANVIVVKKGNEKSAKTQILIEALSQDNIETFIKNKFGDSVIYLG